MKPSQAELLLRMAENTFADGDEVRAEVVRLCTLHAKRVLDDEEYLMKAWEINQRDKARFAQYMPQEHRQAGQQALGRTALIQGGRDEAQTKDQRQKEQRTS